MGAYRVWHTNGCEIMLGGTDKGGIALGPGVW